jgi:predicted porin
MGAVMKSFGIAIAALIAAIGAAQAADLPTMKAPPAPPAANCYASFMTWLDSTAAACPLTYAGITVYGTIDVGGGYETHGVNFNGQSPFGVEELISKNSQGAKWSLVPGGISQSNVGIKATEPLGATGWSIVGNVQTGFDPYGLQLANGPGSMWTNSQLPLQLQNSNGDSSRAGQWDNSLAYAGVSNKTFGTLTWGREYSLTLDGVNAYDPMGGSYAFSPIGFSGKVPGAGSTEDTRPNTAFKYNVAIGDFRASALYQTGGFEQGNGSNGEWEVGVGGDFLSKSLSLDAIYTQVKDQVNLSTCNGTGAPCSPTVDSLKATLSNNDSVMLLAKYTAGPFKLFGGYEYIMYRNPSDAYPAGFNSIGGYAILPGGVKSNAYNDALDFQAFWGGVKYSILSNLDVTGAYYHYIQANYDTNPIANCVANTTVPAPGYSPQGTKSSDCAGTLDAISGELDWKPYKRVDIYAGLMYSQVHGGLASGYLNANNLDPTVGLRVQF